MKPRVLFAGRRRFDFPLEPGLARRYEALSEVFDWSQVGAGRGGGPRFRLIGPAPILDGVLFYVRFPLAVARQLRARRPEVVLVQGAEETALVLLARRLARSRARVVFEVHGDWRAPTRLYGSPLRRLISPVSSVLVRFALRADAVRTVSPYTSRLVRERGVEPAAEFPALMELGAFEGEVCPLPASPSLVFVGALERVKGLDILLGATRRLGDVRLRVIGRGSLAETLDVPGVRHDEWLPARELADVLDESWALVLPSRSEGFGRVVIEAARRARTTVATRVGGIPDLVEDGVTGLLVPPDDEPALAAALRRLLDDRELATRLGRGALARSAAYVATPEEFAARLADLVRHVTKLPA